MRANVDAVAVGIGTVLADDPDLTVRDFATPRRQPTRVVFDSRLRIPLESRLVRTADETPTIVVGTVDDASRRRALEERGVSVFIATDLDAALARLRELDIRALMVEGGPVLAGAFLTAGLVDRLAIFTAPVTLGPDAPQAFAFAPGTLESIETFPVIDHRRFEEDSLVIRALPSREIGRAR